MSTFIMVGCQLAFFSFANANNRYKDIVTMSKYTTIFIDYPPGIRYEYNREGHGTSNIGKGRKK